VSKNLFWLFVASMSFALQLQSIYFLGQNLFDCYGQFYTFGIDAHRVRHDYVASLPEAAALKPDISCLIVDLKYDGETIKILEFGNISLSVLAGHGKLYGPGKIWRGLWSYLKSYMVPVWFVSKKPDRMLQKERCFDRLGDLGVQLVKSGHALITDPLFVKCLNGEVSGKPPKRIEDCKGIIATGVMRVSFRKIFDHFVLLNKYLFNYGNVKSEMDSLFDDDQLRTFRPLCKVYPKKYSEELITEIKNDFYDADRLVIKPVSSSRGLGVIILKKEDLGAVVKKITKDKNTIHENADVSYAHWRTNKNNKFLVESFERSKDIIVQNKRYDGTMRVVFVLSCSGGKIGVKFLGSYWKLPNASLDDNCALQEKHKSKIDEGSFCSAKVGYADITHVKKILSDVLPTMYVKALQIEQQRKR